MSCLPSEIRTPSHYIGGNVEGETVVIGHGYSTSRQTSLISFSELRSTVACKAMKRSW